MELQDLRKLVREGEHVELEFKRKANHPEKIIRELVAFANTKGGQLLIGVDDDGSIYGSKFPLEDIFALQESLQKQVWPRLRPVVERVSINARREVLIFSIGESRRRPHFVKEEGHKKAYVRVRDMSVKASREVVELLRFSSRKGGVRFEVGENEKKVLQYLEDFPRLTLNETRDKLEISRRKASWLLITLVRAGLVRIHPSEKEDFFTLKKDAFTG